MGLTQGEIVLKLKEWGEDVHQSTLSAWENRRQLPEVDREDKVVKALAYALDLQETELINSLDEARADGVKDVVSHNRSHSVPTFSDESSLSLLIESDWLIPCRVFVLNPGALAIISKEEYREFWRKNLGAGGFYDVIWPLDGMDHLEISNAVKAFQALAPVLNETNIRHYSFSLLGNASTSVCEIYSENIRKLTHQTIKRTLRIYTAVKGENLGQRIIEFLNHNENGMEELLTNVRCKDYQQTIVRFEEKAIQLLAKCHIPSGTSALYDHPMQKISRDKSGVEKLTTENIVRANWRLGSGMTTDPRIKKLDVVNNNPILTLDEGEYITGWVPSLTARMHVAFREFIESYDNVLTQYETVLKKNSSQGEQI